MLTDGQMGAVNKGWLVTHRDYTGVFVVYERCEDEVFYMSVNSEAPVMLWSFVDEEELSVYELK